VLSVEGDRDGRADRDQAPGLRAGVAVMRSPKRVWFGIVVIWMMFGIVGAGFYDASLIHTDPNCDGTNNLDSRQDQVFSLAGSLTGPAMFIAGLITSGFGETGWTLSGNNNCSKVLKQ
jgi:hypothetical protein